MHFNQSLLVRGLGIHVSGLQSASEVTSPKTLDKFFTKDRCPSISAMATVPTVEEENIFIGSSQDHPLVTSHTTDRTTTPDTTTTPNDGSNTPNIAPNTLGAPQDKDIRAMNAIQAGINAINAGISALSSRIGQNPASIDINNVIQALVQGHPSSAGLTDLALASLPGPQINLANGGVPRPSAVTSSTSATDRAESLPKPKSKSNKLQTKRKRNSKKEVVQPKGDITKFFKSTKVWFNTLTLLYFLICYFLHTYIGCRTQTRQFTKLFNLQQNPVKVLRPY